MRPGDVAAWLDTAPPTTADDVDAAWHTSPVTVTLSANDGGGLGIDKTYYTIGGSPSDPGLRPPPSTTPPNRPTLDDGERIKYFSTDLAGNTEAVRTSAAANVDGQAPKRAEDHRHRPGSHRPTTNNPLVSGNGGMTGLERSPSTHRPTAPALPR